MELTSVLAQIEKFSEEIERIFASLSQLFPSLLDSQRLCENDADAGEQCSLRVMDDILNQLKDSHDESIREDGVFFREYNNKYTNLFDVLSRELTALDTLNERIDAVKADSEELEIIALNAMVVSIKSGESGRAFSCITENLKLLSGNMIVYSGRLIDEEKSLLAHIADLRSLYASIKEIQQAINALESDSAEIVDSLIKNASSELEKINADSKSVSAPILAAMEGVQLQDIIRQTIDHAVMCLKNVEPAENAPDLESTLDVMAFNIALMKLTGDVIDDICDHIEQSAGVFNENWKKVGGVLSVVEDERVSYLSRFLDERGESADNLSKRLEDVNRNFQSLIEKINQYQYVQKNMVVLCNTISAEVKRMRSVFENLRPVINRLHHVRISQQIESSKNKAISAVKDMVSHMDELINHTQENVDVTRKGLESFIKNISSLVMSFTGETTHDNQRLSAIRNNKSVFFRELKDIRERLTLCMRNFSVYPADFAQECKDVDRMLEDLQRIRLDFLKQKDVLINEIDVSQAAFDAKLRSSPYDSWEIRDDRFKELIDHFTIAAHKEKAGEIAGFTVESGASAGDITFF